MFNDVKADFNRFCQVDYGVSAENCKNKMRVCFNSYGLQVLAAHRLYRWILQKTNIILLICKLPLIPICFFLYKIAGKLYDIKISPQALIGPGCYIGHFGGIRIGRCQIGKLCNINHQVKIGCFSHEDSGKQVVIAERVWIGAHSKIMKGVHIGGGVVISAGTIVASDIQNKALVAGPSSRVLKRNYDNTAMLGILEN